MPSMYKSVSKEEFHLRYEILADPFSVRLMSYIKQDSNPNNFVKDENFFYINEENGKSLLHEAAIQENIEFIHVLKEAGYDINRQDKEYKTPLYDACSQLKLRSVEFLLDNGADPNLGNSHLTFEGNREENGIVKSVKYQGETIPLTATIHGLATGFSDDSLATGFSDDSLATGFSDLAIDSSAERERKAGLIAEKLIEKGANVNLQTGLDHFSALHRAITYKSILVIKKLLNSNKVNPLLVDRDGETGLHIVANYRRRTEKDYESLQMQKEKAIAELIIPYVKTLEMRELKFGNTPLHTAVIRSNALVVKLLYQKDYMFQHRKILSIQNKAGNTAIHEAVIAAKRGPNILKLLLRVATKDDLAIENRLGRTVSQLSENLFQESVSMNSLIQDFKKAENNLDILIENYRRMTDFKLKDGSVVKMVDLTPLSEAQLIKLKSTISEISTVVDNLKANQFFYNAIMVNSELGYDNYLGDDINDLSNNLKHFEQTITLNREDYILNPIEMADIYHTQALKLREDIENSFLDKSYIESLTSVRQEEYLSWKNQILTLPSSFPDLRTISYHSKNYKSSFNKANQLLSLAETDLTKKNNNAQKNIEEAIEIFYQLKAYNKVEEAYKILAKIAINNGLNSIVSYEKENQNKLLSLDHQEKLQGYLALGEFYNELIGRRLSSPFSLPLTLHISEAKLNRLIEQKSYYFYQAYKLTQGQLDNTAHVVLQRELGILNNARAGTYNIQQCIVAVAFDPISKKVVLSHFDKFSGPLSFIDELLHEFPEHSKINLYLSGARDRISLASSSSTSTISDNNIEQVLKQIFAEKKRFVIKSSDIGDKPSPEAVVFDTNSERLVHAVPDFPDNSIDSREMNFQLQLIKGDYLRPLNRIDFSANEASRKISFSNEQQERISQYYSNYRKNPTQTDAWNHLIFYPLMVNYNELKGITKSDYSQALLTVTNRLDPIIPMQLDNGASHDSIIPMQLDNDASHDSIIPMQLDNDASHDSIIPMEQDNNAVDTSQDFDPESLPCLISRRKRGTKTNCELDSELLLDYLKDLTDSKQAEILDYLSSRTVAGTKKEQVSRLVYNEKIKTHLASVSQFSSNFVQALLAEGAIASLFHGDPTAAANLITFVGSNHLFGKISQLIAEKGTRLLETGKIFSGQVFRASAPFIARGTSLLFVYDLYTQIKAIENNSNDTSAWVNAISDGIFLSMDVAEIGIEVAEISSEAIAALEISSFSNPITATLGAIIMVGTQIYESVKKVQSENQLVHLTGWEKFKEGWAAFLMLDSESYIEKMINEANQYKQLLKEKKEFMKNFSKIKYYVFPSIEQVGKECQVVTTKEWPCKSAIAINYMPVIESSPCFTSKTNCVFKFNSTLDNWIYFKRERTSSELKVTREVISSPLETQLLCLPSTEDGIPSPREIVYRCDGALALNITNNTLGNTALYDLGDGKDYAFGFEFIPNIFIVNNGEKRYVGGKRDDIFLVKASKIVSAFNLHFLPSHQFKGGIDGKRGIDTLSLEGFKPATENITIDLNKGFLKYDNSDETLVIKNIENLVCGEFPLSVIVGCDTQRVDIAGGSTLKKADTIFIPKISKCRYVTTFHLKPYSNLNNQALEGHFTYIIQPGMGIISVNLTTENTNETLRPLEFLSHQFVFNVDISDLYAISSSKQNITLHFSENKINRILRAIETISIAKNNASDTVTLDYQFKSSAFLNQNYLDLLPKVIELNHSPKKLKALFKNHDANSTLTIGDRNEIQIILFYFMKTSELFSNNFKVELIFSLNNFLFHFIDGTEIQISNRINYLFFSGDLNINDIMTFYSPIARRLNMVCNIKTLKDQRVLISHYGHQVMHNDRYAYETHINSNGGQVLLTIQPLLPSILSALNEVILHHAPHSKNIDTLDFRQIKAKIQTEYGIEAAAINLMVLSRHNINSFRFIASKEERKIENDVLLTLHVKVGPNVFLDFISVRLKDALLNHWYQDHLQIILTMAPLKIVGNFTNLSLKPIPLILEDTHEFISIGVEDVEKYTEIIISKNSNYGKFYQQNKTNLIYTNTLLNISPIKLLSIFLKNFYTEPKLATLIFKFSNKEVMLTENFTAWDLVEDFESAKTKKEEILNKESNAMLVSNSIQQTQPTKKDKKNESNNLTRRRRSTIKLQSKNTDSRLISTTKEQTETVHFFTKKSISSRDSAQERADAYYDRYDRIKEKSRPKKKAKLKIKEAVNKSPMDHGSKNVANTLNIKQQLSTLVKTRKTTCEYQKLSNPIVTPKSTYFKKALTIKQKQTQLNQTIGTINLSKKITNNQKGYLHSDNLSKKITNNQKGYLHSEENSKTRLNNRYQLHQQSSKSEGISRVNASSDLQSTLVALNFVAKCLNKENNRTIVKQKIRQAAAYKRQAKKLGMNKPLGV